MIGWGIIGCGDVTEVKSGPGLQKARGSRLIAVMRRNGALAADYARRHGVASSYDDAERLISDPRVDAVYIATPPGAHTEYALRVCAAGKPAYVEKPMARNHAECRSMISAFEKAEVPLFVAYYRRALPRFQKAQELVVSGAIGRAVAVTYRFAAPHHVGLEAGRLPWRVQAEHAGGGLLLDLGSHTLDILDFILGPLSSVRGAAVNVVSAHAVEDTVAMSFTTAAGVTGSALWSFASAERADEICFMGTEGELTLSTFGDEPLTLRRSSGTEHFDLPNPPHIQQPLIQTIVDELEGHGRCPSTGASAARTSLVMDQVLEGYYGGRDDEFWRRADTWPGRR
jgi:1,5-anhydro-D-fructose reductase (1,5-anhydro-D-mannitol-forming)